MRIKKEGLFVMYGFRLLIVFCAVFCIASCDSDDDHVITEPKNGFWLIEDKGYIIEFTDGNDLLYSISTAGCTIMEDDFKPEELGGLLFEQVSEDELLGISDLFVSEIKATRLLNQNELCLPNQVGDTDDPKVNFDYFWNIFNDYYAFFERRNIDWSSYKNLRDQVNQDNFYDVIEELVLQLKDGHVSVKDERNGIEIESGFVDMIERLNANLEGTYRIENTEDYWDILDKKMNTIARTYLKGEFAQNEGENMFWGLITDQIGYVTILEMEDFGNSLKDERTALSEVLDEMMNDIEESGISKLIIDIRANGGGHDKIGLDIASRFIDKQTLVGTKKARLGDGFTEPQTISIDPKGEYQFTGDIVLLTSPVTSSAAEVFTMAMKDLPYVNLVGENTNGILSDELTHALPNGARIVLSNEVYSDAEGTVFEMVGMGPEKEENKVPFLSTLDFENEIDTGIERAMELLR